MKNNSRRTVYGLAVLVVAMFMPLSAGTLAWGADWRWPYPQRASILTREQENRLQQFLRNHPNVYRDLQRNPNLANERSYLRRHGDFREFLSDHGGIRAAFRANPSAVMASVGYGGPHRSWDRDRWSSDRDRWRGR